MLRQLLFFLLIVAEGWILNGEPFKINLPFMPDRGTWKRFLISNHFIRNQPKHVSRNVSYSSDETSSRHNDSISMMVSDNETLSSWAHPVTTRNAKIKIPNRLRRMLNKFLDVMFPGAYVDVDGKLYKRSHLLQTTTTETSETSLSEDSDSVHYESGEQSENQTLNEKNFKFSVQQYKSIWKNFKTRVRNYFSKFRGLMSRFKRRKGTVKENGAATKEPNVSYNVTTLCQCEPCVAYRLRMLQQQQQQS